VYNKLIIFDLDGVLIDSRDLHYKALNKALEEVVGYTIPYEEHLSTYDGLPTKRKLELLTKHKGLNPLLYDDIFQSKQKWTVSEMNSIQIYEDVIPMMVDLYKRGYKIAIASNAVRSTVINAIMTLDIMKYVDYFISNEDVKRTKPYPEMYWRCMEACNALPSTTYIVEDSHIGREGATNSGATLIAVENATDDIYGKFMQVLESGTANLHKPNIKWKDSKLNIVVPMAGAGSRFAAMGYTFPKPLIEVRGKPMIQTVVESLNIEAKYIFICQEEHYEKYNLNYMLNLISPACLIIPIKGVTEGAACTVLRACDYIDNNQPLLIANSDQFVKWNSNEVMYAFSNDNIDGGILTFKSTHPKWSYSKLGKDGFVDEVAEKMVISDNATCGIYYWKKGSNFVKYANRMIEKNIRVNKEFYVAPVFNLAIEDGLKFRIKEAEQMWGLGTPEDLNYFLTHYKE
jgi:HAD superfamily hydrolase (TIGR01509 family)